eukprot:SAG25_NODE_11812_length_294_cov_1.271795_1_plen_71_part_01
MPTSVGPTSPLRKWGDQSRLYCAAAEMCQRTQATVMSVWAGKPCKARLDRQLRVQSGLMAQHLANRRVEMS